MEEQNLFNDEKKKILYADLHKSQSKNSIIVNMLS